ncbi:hypothetical protein GH714_024005 [Hevea brasiliensis]|uniref:Myb-like domain-containing protein n=1 Tax=Hevea brasiliensis TaxID=3981 RepID=A0A6A6L0H9_HEVBR|nr:hypothetical protein GH714_024005 [Hevea brasiliensis]
MADHQYGVPDLRQLVAGRTHFQGIPLATEPFFLQTRTHGPQIHHFHHDSIIAAAAHSGAEVMLPSGFVQLAHHDHYCTNASTIPSTTTTTTIAIDAASSGAAGSFFGVEMENGWIGNDAGNYSRWPRQETLTLLEIRSRLDSRFKEANQKGPLWDEVSRIMAEEHGYQRSGKKCREKFENLYKYYKKTKEGKAGRQDGKHYRFFRQLEALYGETSNNQTSASETHLINNSTSFLYQTPTSLTINQENQEGLQENKHSDQSLSFSNTSEFETSSSENNDDDLSAIAYMMNRSIEKQKGLTESQSYTRAKKNWKTKVKEFVDLQMRKLLERQEVWMERILKTIEDREQERMCKEEEWTKQEVARLDRIHEFWAKERAWIEARDAALMEALKKHAGKGLELLLPSSTSVDEQIAIATQSHYRNQDRHAKKNGIDEMNTMRWTEPEIFSLIQIITSVDPRFLESGHSKAGLWEEIAAKMHSLGYGRSVDECKQKWGNMNIYFNMTATECNKKRKEDLRTSNYFHPLDPYNDQEMAKLETLNSPSSNSCVSRRLL